MAYGDVNEVHRSVRRWVARLLDGLGDGLDWTIHTEQRYTAEGDLARPLGWVEMATPVSPTRPVVIGAPQPPSQVTATFVATLLPPATETPRQATAAAFALAALLHRSATVGVVREDPTATPGGFRGLSPAGTIPLYDFADVPIDGPDRGGPDWPVGYATVDSVSARPIPDPDSDVLYAVVLSLGLGWAVAGRDEDPAPIATAMPHTFIEK